jgi:hypothetical protein
VKVPERRWLLREQVVARAQTFLEQHHPSGEIPIPVEDIVDVQLDLVLPDGRRQL